MIKLEDIIVGLRRRNEIEDKQVVEQMIDEALLVLEDLYVTKGRSDLFRFVRYNAENHSLDNVCLNDNSMDEIMKFVNGEFGALLKEKAALKEQDKEKEVGEVKGDM